MRRSAALASGVAALLLAAASISAAGSDPPATVAYDLYVGFTAEQGCVPEDGPYVTKLSLDLHVPNLRFVFAERKVDADTTVSWYPVVGGAKTGGPPTLAFTGEGTIDVAICPHTRCKGKIERCWLTNRDGHFQAVLTVLPVNEIEEMRDELLDPHVTGDMKGDTVSLAPAVMHVKLLARDRFTWTCECTVGGQDAGNTHDLEFYVALPPHELKAGREVSREFPIQSDDVDSPGTLTVRLIPKGGIK